MVIDKSGMFGEILEQGQTVGKAVKKQIADTAKTVASQVTGVNQNPSQAQPVPGKVDENFVKDLYGVKDETNQTSQKPKTQQSSVQGNQGNQNQKNQITPEEANDPKKMEEKQRLAKLRQELHMKTYYEPTFNPPKKQEERPAEKVEKEKQEEQMELAKKQEEKPKPIAVQRAQRGVEVNRGVSG
jgi:hypothetical protein